MKLETCFQQLLCSFVLSQNIQQVRSCVGTLKPQLAPSSLTVIEQSSGAVASLLPPLVIGGCTALFVFLVSQHSPHKNKVIHNISMFVSGCLKALNMDVYILETFL